MAQVMMELHITGMTVMVISGTGMDPIITLSAMEMPVTMTIIMRQMIMTHGQIREIMATIIMITMMMIMTMEMMTGIIMIIMMIMRMMMTAGETILTETGIAVSK